MPDDHQVNGVRVTTYDIYQMVSKTDRNVVSVKQTIEEVIRPAIQRHETRLNEMDREKADRDLVDEVRSRTATLELRTYAIIGGLIAALFGAKGLGLL